MEPKILVSKILFSILLLSLLGELGRCGQLPLEPGVAPEIVDEDAKIEGKNFELTGLCIM